MPTPPHPVGAPAGPAGAGAPHLSDRERQVAELYVAGQSYKEIARVLGISPATVTPTRFTASSR